MLKQQVWEHWQVEAVGAARPMWFSEVRCCLVCWYCMWEKWVEGKDHVSRTSHEEKLCHCVILFTLGATLDLCQSSASPGAKWQARLRRKPQVVCGQVKGVTVMWWACANNLCLLEPREPPWPYSGSRCLFLPLAFTIPSAATQS